MNYKISHPTKKLTGSINLTASKSESNRALIIQSLCEDKFEINNLATAEDTQTLQRILKTPLSKIADNVFNVGAAGTTMRFLTAYLSTKEGTHILTGTDRMKNRPIGILVNALRELGATIEYMEEQGFPPLKIKGNKFIKGGEVRMDGDVSSQFISALLLVSNQFQNGLVIKFNGRVISRPYINMTLKMLQEFRVYGQWQEDAISVSKQAYHAKSEKDYSYNVEGDWSSASYWYSIAAMANEVDFTINGLKKGSLQGDAIVADLFTFFGIKTTYTETGIHLSKLKSVKEQFGFDFSDCPDLVQSVAVAAAALGVQSYINGVQTLRIKETDRIAAIQTELKKLEVPVDIIDENNIAIPKIKKAFDSVSIATYNDHRTAMAFAPLSMKLKSLVIENAEVVNKSYPEFWNDMKSVGFVLEEID